MTHTGAASSPAAGTAPQGALAAGGNLGGPSRKLRVLDLFSGIGGFSLGLERTGGFETVAFCEIEPFPRRVLAKHWPGVPIYEDVRTLTADALARDGIGVDVICGGFPCQDISSAGTRAGLEGERSRLWTEYARLIGELRPSFLIVENVPDIRSRGLGRVLGDLAEIGFDAEWHCIPAGTLGAPHIRDRFWLVGYPNGEGQPTLPFHDEASWLPSVAADTNGEPPLGPAISWRERLSWPDEPPVLGVDDGVPDRMDRVRAVGNTVIPAIPELIGRAILAAEAALPIAAE